MRILIAEDDVPLANFLKKGLEAEHYAADVSPDGEQSRAMATEFEYDLVVLDLNMPRLDGVAILRHLRTKKPSMPVLVLTGRTRVEDRVQCLDLGADDYLVKPFSFAELSARIRALLRRSHLPAESVLAVDDLKLDRVERRVERSGRRIELTSKEFALLEYLMRNAGRRITRAMIIEHVWNLSFDTCTNVVDVYIFVFSGTEQVTPYVVDAAEPSGVRYDGNDGPNTVTIGNGYQLQVNLPGSQLFSSAGADVFQAMSDLITAVTNNTGVDTALASVRHAFDYVTAQRVFYGNGMNQMEAQRTFLDAQKTQLSSQENTLVGADMASAASQLVNTENARSATLAAIGRISQNSLFDYLK